MTPEELYLANENLVHYVLSKNFKHKMSDEDYQQIGRIGLWKACLKYEPNMGTFATFAVPCILNSIRMEMRNSQAKIRSNPDYIFMSLQQPIKGLDNEEATIAELVAGESDEGFLDLEGLWRCLTSRERFIMAGLIDGKNQAQIAEDLGIARSNVSRSVTQIRKKWAEYI